MTAGRPDLCRNRCPDDLRQLACRLNLFFLSCLHDVFCNILRKPILTVVPDDPVQFHLTVGIDDVLRGLLISLIHPHIQRRIVLAIGKSPFRCVKLEGRNTQIQINSIHLRNLQLI